MNRSEILLTAQALTMGTKAKEHGNGKETALYDNFRKIAALWSAYLNVDITPGGVAHLLVLLKMARSLQNPILDDNYIDAAAYIAIAGELTGVSK